MEILELRTADLAIEDRFPYWLEMASQTHVPSFISTDHAADFEASVRVLDLGGLQVSALSHPTVRVARPTRLVRQCDPEVFQLHLFTGGTGALTQSGREAVFGVREFLLIDSSRPYNGWRAAGGAGLAEGLVVQFPRAALALGPELVGRLVATPLPGQGGIGGVLAGHLTDLMANAEGYTPGDRAALASVTLDLIAAVCAHHLEAATALSPESRRHALLSLVHGFIRQRLGDPDLNAETIAAAHQISVRHLYKLFQEQGVGVAAWIRRCRLERCRHDLADPRQRSRPVQAVARRWGFTDGAHFSRAFRAEYGVSPRDYRNLAADLDGDQAGPS
ncbi:helix-turn-helix domain-containing protein [Sphaerisporangium fuscum]|uniref:helix-turn-helix domain-containing protein n=1 Tax=Sphaerisporangium fuscum TaxID=2835868 RepID=UPI001BDD3856|nr:helix-turn-helix domain-containing protein [Sphaerisporangium fuscum]